MTDHSEASKFLSNLADMLWQPNPGETTEDICRELRAEGLEPDSLLARVRNLVAEVSDERRLAWMKNAEEERQRALLRLADLTIEHKSRADILVDLGNKKQLAARNLETPLEEMSDEQLRLLYEETKLAEALDEMPSEDQ